MATVVGKATADFAVKVKKPAKMGVVRYCQLKELSSGIASIMKRRYSQEIHTMEEWDELLDFVLHRKVN